MNYLTPSGECGHPKLGTCKRCGYDKFTGNSRVGLLTCEQCQDVKWNDYYNQIDIDRFHAEGLRDGMKKFTTLGIFGSDWRDAKEQINAILRCMEGK